MSKSEKISWTYWMALLAVLLLFSYGCTSKTKFKSETQEKKKIDSVAVVIDSTAKVQEFVSSKMEDFKQQLSEMGVTGFDEKVIVTETIETLEYTGTGTNANTGPDKNHPNVSDDGVVRSAESPSFIVETHDGTKLRVAGNGRVTRITTTTETHTTRKQIEQRNREIAEKSQKKMDSINREAALKKMITDIKTETETETKTKAKAVDTKFRIPWWLWVIPIVVFMIYVFRKWIGAKLKFVYNWFKD